MPKKPSNRPTSGGLTNKRKPKMERTVRVSVKKGPRLVGHKFIDSWKWDPLQAQVGKRAAKGRSKKKVTLPKPVKNKVRK